MYKPGIFRWFSPKELSEYTNSDDLAAVAAVLKEQGVRIVKGGLWNLKAPDPVLFTSRPYVVTSELEALALSNYNLMIEEDHIGLRSSRLSIVYEK